jgi:hypothetical protein
MNINKLLLIISLILAIYLLFKIVNFFLRIKWYTFNILKNQNLHFEKIQKGKQHFLENKILIVGTIRNGEKTLPKSIEFLYKQIIPRFKDYQIIVMENDSEDNTRKYLLDLSRKDNKLKVIGCDGINLPECKLNLEKTDMKKCPECITRINKMVYIRNVYLDEIKKPEYRDFNYVLMFDMDLYGQISNNGLYDTGYNFLVDKNIDAVCAMTISPSLGYYDAYAHLDWYKKSYKHETIMKNLARCGMDKVSSCFNGFTIYRRSSLLDKKYCTYIDGKNNHSICEHTCFHEQMNNVYINYNMIFKVPVNSLDNSLFSILFF